MLTPRAARSALPGLVVLALAAAACGSANDRGSSDATQTLPAESAHKRAVRVAMRNLEFVPTTVDARVGQTVRWRNKDNAPHNVIYKRGPRFASSRILWPGQIFSIRLTEPGTIHYYCSIHPWMQATIIVSR
ncbi:MAG: cupredoxin domain-containing protein [Solirubrobacteraceae bacterium]